MNLGLKLSSLFLVSFELFNHMDRPPEQICVEVDLYVLFNLAPLNCNLQHCYNFLPQSLLVILKEETDFERFVNLRKPEGEHFGPLKLLSFELNQSSRLMISAPILIEINPACESFSQLYLSIIYYRFQLHLLRPQYTKPEIVKGG